MRLDRLLTLYLAHPLRKLACGDSPGVSILMYHRISASPEPDLSPYYKLNTSPKTFREHLEILKQEGCKVVNLATCLEMLTNRSVTGRVVLITFDDGYEDVYTEAFPLLEEYNFPATVFLPTEYIGESPRMFKNTQCLKWSQVREMHRRGFAFGSHTVSHPKLRNLGWEEINQELRASREAIEDNLQETVNSFAYPYAYPEMDKDFVIRFTEALRTTGYASCLTTRIGRVFPGDDLFSLKRLPANQCDDRMLLFAKLQGSYDWLSLPQRMRKVARARTSLISA